jgi:nicotinamidase/pyrazinamidase
MVMGILLVDPQMDFFPGGALGVRGGDDIIAPINALLDIHPNAPLFVSRDWHPEGTKHFAARGGPWPVHCVAGTSGASFHPGLRLDARDAVVVSKGTDPNDDAGYSSFEGKKDDVLLLQWLQRAGVDALIVAGLATDHCVKATVLSSRNAGLPTFVLAAGVRAVNVTATDEAAAWEAMLSAGALRVA